jgi:hypothetical protein
MARSLDQIIAEMDPGYAPSRDIVTQQINALDPAQQAQEQGLNAQKDQGFKDIVDQARTRGMGFGGIPLSEQATYLSSNYLPALANLKSTFATKKADLASTLADLNKEQRNTALGLQQTELNREEQAREAAAARAAAASAASSNSDWLSALTGGGRGGADNAPAWQKLMQQKAGGGFNFQDLSGKATSAATFAKINGINIADLLHNMANSGDKFAGAAYSDIARNNGKITPQLMSKYSSLFWGEVPAAPQPPKKTSVAQGTLKTAFTPNILGINNPMALRR